MFLFQVFIHRELTPEQGQQYLQHMISEIDRNPTQWTPGACKIPGVNRFENPFPDWLSSTLQQYGFEYDSINLCYAGRFQSESAAEVWRNWFDNTVRPWAAQYGLNTTNVHCRVMCEHPEVDAMLAY